MASKRSGSAQPKYQEIADDLRAKIDGGEYSLGAQLPTRAELMAEHDAALGTVERALDLLRQLGMIETYQGVGTFVRKKSPAAGTGGSERVAALEDRVAYLEAQLMDLYASQGLTYQAWTSAESQAEAV